MKQIPQTFRVGPYNYAVRKVRHLAAGANHYGEHDPWREEIVIDESLSETNGWQTVLHEVVHAADMCFHCFGVEDDEKQTDQIATVLLLLLKDNGFLDA